MAYKFCQNLWAGFIVFLYTLLLIIPGIYKAVQYTFISNLISDEETKPLEKSKLLVKDNWFNILGMLVITFFIAFGIELVIAIPLIFMIEDPIITIVSGVIAAIGSSYAIVIKGVYYVKLKELKLDKAKSILLHS